jgi:hypothetical protein
VYLPGGFPEPNQLTGSENCVVANFTQSTGALSRTGQQAWGWSDVNCQSFYISVCKIPRELRWAMELLQVAATAPRVAHTCVQLAAEYKAPPPPRTSTPLPSSLLPWHLHLGDVLGGLRSLLTPRG